MANSIGPTPNIRDQSAEAQKSVDKGKQALSDICDVALESVLGATASAPPGVKMQLPAVASSDLEEGWVILQGVPENLRQDAKNKSHSVVIVPNDEQLKKQAADTLSSSVKLDPGREKLLQEMKKSPEQLLKDVRRPGTLRIGHKTFDLGKLEGKAKAEDLYRLALYNIRAHIQAATGTKVSQSVVNEILYASTQQFLQSTEFRYAKDAVPGGPLDISKWVPGEKTLSTAFEMTKKLYLSSSVLEITKSEEILFTNKEDESAATKLLKKEVRITYNLEKNSVTYHYTYTLDGKKSPWSTKDPLKK